MKGNCGLWDDVMAMESDEFAELVEDKTSLRDLVNTAKASRRGELLLLMAEQLTDSVKTGDGMLTPEQMLFVGSTM